QQVRREDDPSLWGNLQGALASSLAKAHGYRFTDAIFQRVLRGYQLALSVFSPTESPKQWAATLRNIGSTYIDATESGLGDMQSHVEAAIGALTDASTISPAAEPEMWRGALSDLASALRTAAAWRGEAALFDSASLYGEILRDLPGDAPPGLRASL